MAPPLGYGPAQPVAAAAASLDDDGPFVPMLKSVLRGFLRMHFRHVVVVVSDSDKLGVSRLGLQAAAAARLSGATIAVVCASDSGGLERELARTRSIGTNVCGAKL